jgi:hypothetical protein
VSHVSQTNQPTVGAITLPPRPAPCTIYFLRRKCCARNELSYLLRVDINIIMATLATPVASSLLRKHSADRLEALRNRKKPFLLSFLVFVSSLTLSWQR